MAEPASGVVPDPYVEEKIRQRREALETLPRHETILELYAGEGVLSKEVYAKAARLLVLVDDEESRLGRAVKKLRR